MKYLQMLFVVLLISGCSIDTTKVNDLTLYSDLSEKIILEDGAEFELIADEVKMSVSGKDTEMLAYNGSIPGPILIVEQGSTINVNFKNQLDIDSSLHSHGLRLRNQFDGVPGLTQEEVEPGGQFLYELDFPDVGVYFYHPHTREDYQQDAGLYGAFIVLPSDNMINEFGLDLEQDHRVVFLDDLQINEMGEIERNKEKVEQTLMGRFGNTMFIDGKLNGVADLGKFNKGEEAIYTFINVANARPYNLVIPGVEMTLLADDASALTKSKLIKELIVGPSERYTVKLRFVEAGDFEMVSTKGEYDYKIGKVSVKDSDKGNTQKLNFAPLQMSNIDSFLNMPIEKTLRLDMSMDMAQHSMTGIPCHKMPDGSWMGDCQNLEEANHSNIQKNGIEWEDEMPIMNASSNLDNVRWDLVDAETDLKNMDIDWRFEKGDLVKIRIENLEDSMHPMQHPIHLHGQRFLVLTKDGRTEDTFAWNDTVLVPAGKTYEIIVEMTNPGKWMVHCHIPEHMEAGMMMKFIVE